MTRTLDELIDVIQGGSPQYDRFESDAKKSQRANFPIAVKELREKVRDAEIARIDADGFRSVVVAKAQRIAELEAEVAQLNRANAIADEGVKDD